MAEQYKTLPPTPEEQIEKRLTNAMRLLKLEMASQGVDVDAIGCTYMVAWENGAVSVHRADIIPPYDNPLPLTPSPLHGEGGQESPKSRNKRKEGSDAAEG